MQVGIKRLGNAVQRIDGRIDNSAPYSGKIRLVDSGQIGKSLLQKSFLRLNGGLKKGIIKPFRTLRVIDNRLQIIYIIYIIFILTVFLTVLMMAAIWHRIMSKRMGKSGMNQEVGVDLHSECMDDYN